MAQQADRSLVVGMHFETADQADRNLQPRVDLASGPAPGQGGSFADRFAVASGEADGQDVVLDHEADRAARPRAVRPDLRPGPVRHLLTGSP